MIVAQCRWTEAEGWIPSLPSSNRDANLLLVFAGSRLLKEGDLLRAVSSAYPSAQVFGCSTAGEICGTEITDGSCVVTAVTLEHTHVRGTLIPVAEDGNSFDAGAEAARELLRPGLAHVVVLSDGLQVNGSDLVRGLTSKLPEEITVTGGLAGDETRFGETVVLWNEHACSGAIAAIGFYGERLRVGYGSMGGWDPFGPERLVTLSRGNVVYEFDDRSALELYKRYLGEHASGLPATGLLFPLSVRTSPSDPGVVRTLQSVNEKDQSITFVGDVPQGAYARLMKANFDRLIDGAVGAARTSYEAIGSVSPDLALLISCVGRRMLLKQRSEEEVEGVREVLGQETVLTGFYSYGEISPFTPSAKCELHNQTMTITTLSEK